MQYVANILISDGNGQSNSKIINAWQDSCVADVFLFFKAQTKQIRAQTTN